MPRTAPRHRVADATPVLDTLSMRKVEITRAAVTTGALAAVPVMLATPAFAQVPVGVGSTKTASTSAAPNGATVTVRSGDTVSALARRAGVSTTAMLTANGLTARTLIFPGQVLRIPGPGVAAARAAEPAPVAEPAPAPSGSRADAVLALARAQIGIDYAYGEETPAAGFDCSGLVMYVYGKAAGVSTPRTTGALRSFGTRVSAAEARPGDLVLFDDYKHVAIYAGNGKIIDAPRTGSEVSERKLWTDRVVYRRVL